MFKETSRILVWRTLPPNKRGIYWIAFSGLALAVMATMIKLAGARLHVLEILFVRQVVMMTFMLPISLKNPFMAFSTTNLRLQLLRVLLSVVATLSGFTAIVHLQLSDAIALSFSRMFFVATVAFIILHEMITPRRWSILCLGFIGILIITRPSAMGVNLYSVLGLCSAATVGLIAVMVRKLSEKEKLATVLTYQAFGAVLLLPALSVWQAPTPAEWLFLILAALMSVLAQSLNFAGFRVGEAAAVTSSDYLQLGFVVLIDLLAFDITPLYPTLIGVGVIIAASVYALYTEQTATTAVKLSGG
ncbi:DMT family transporter [Bradyrhizobium sp. RT9a]|uniref:DMT family transporter n=1 Tax=Bradyrhizobium sp. RT9a TaxID=3156384 RepID=UPI0033957819